MVVVVVVVVMTMTMMMVLSSTTALEAAGAASLVPLEAFAVEAAVVVASLDASGSPQMLAALPCISRQSQCNLDWAILDVGLKGRLLHEVWRVASCAFLRAARW